MSFPYKDACMYLGEEDPREGEKQMQTEVG